MAFQTLGCVLLDDLFSSVSESLPRPIGSTERYTKAVAEKAVSTVSPSPGFAFWPHLAPPRASFPSKVALPDSAVS